MAGLGRFVQDMLLWSTAEFGCLRLGDGFVQGSSIMPQKRNPVALEHARAIASKAIGEAAAILIAVHNTPFGDVVDTEDDLQPLVDRLFHDAARALALVAAAMATATFDAAVMARRAGEGGITMTELADTLVRDHGLAFDTAHAIARRIVSAKAADAGARVSEVLAQASAELAGAAIHYTEDEMAAILGPRHFVEVRTTPGGPAPAETARAAAASLAALETDRSWVRETQARLEAARAELARRSAGL